VWECEWVSEWVMCGGAWAYSVQCCSVPPGTVCGVSGV
jgi:hypothetical protein